VQTREIIGDSVYFFELLFLFKVNVLNLWWWIRKNK